MGISQAHPVLQLILLGIFMLLIAAITAFISLTVMVNLLPVGVRMDQEMEVLLASMSSANSMITVQAEEPVYYPENSHYYELKKVSRGITWEDAKNIAQSLSYSGMTGHLATITSQDENDFIVDKLDPTYSWIGVFQPDGSEEPAGGWQ